MDGEGFAEAEGGSEENPLEEERYPGSSFRLTTGLSLLPTRTATGLSLLPTRTATENHDVTFSSTTYFYLS